MFLKRCLKGIMVVYLMTAQAKAQQGLPANVNIATIEQTQLTPSVWVSGTIVSHNNAKIAAEVSGRLTHIIALGARVTKNQVIATLDERQITLQQNEARANVASAQATLAFDESELKRTKTLFNQKLVSETNLAASTAKYHIAQANLAGAKARLAQIEQDLYSTQLLAPFDGIVAQRLSNLGEYVNKGTAIVRLVETAHVEASVFAPLTSYQYLKQNEKLAIRSPFGEGFAAIKALIPVADAQSHLMEVRLDMTPFDWPIGLNISAAIPNKESKQVLAISSDALVLRRSGTSIFVIDDQDIAQQIDITVGIAQDHLVEVVGDVKPGDRVVIRGAERLKTGQKVMIKSNNHTLISGNK